MKHYRVTLVPQSSLFLGRDRGNRIVRRSFHYIPASTVGGALNTYFYQTGWDEGLAGRFRFGNLYPAVETGDGSVWLPAPRNLYYCPNCRTGHLIEDFRPKQALAELICPDCSGLRRPERGVVEARLSGDLFEVHPGQRKATPPEAGALTVGRTELHRTTAAHVGGRLHMIELLRVRGVPFHGDVWVNDAATDVIHPGVTFRLSVGGLRSRGCGSAELHIGGEVTDTPDDDRLLLAETPLLPLPDGMAATLTFRTTVATPYASVVVSERWAARPLEFGKGLVSFLDTIAVGSAFTATGDVALGERMFFYRLSGQTLELYGFDHTACVGHDYGAGYDFADLWTLGYGRVRRLLTTKGQPDRVAGESA